MRPTFFFHFPVYYMKHHFFLVVQILISVILENREGKEICVNNFSIKLLHIISATKDVAMKYFMQ